MENIFLCCTSLNVKPAFYLNHSLNKSNKNNSYSEYFNQILKKVDKLEEENKILKEQIENTYSDNEISFEKLDKLNEKNKSLLKECNLTKEDVTLPNLNSKYKNIDTSKKEEKSSIINSFKNLISRKQK
jgi:hypothetical protein